MNINMPKKTIVYAVQPLVTGRFVMGRFSILGLMMGRGGLEALALNSQVCNDPCSLSNLRISLASLCLFWRLRLDGSDREYRSLSRAASRDNSQHVSYGAKTEGLRAGPRKEEYIVGARTSGGGSAFSLCINTGFYVIA